MSCDSFFISGISTEVGKTLAAAIFVEALRADYWKPIQSGDLDHSDSHKISELVSFPVKIHPNSYALKRPLSPHASAEHENININIENIVRPISSQPLVIEGAGGILVPLNDKDTMIDIIRPKDKVVIVSRHYLGSINHSLMTIYTLQSKGIKVGGIVFSGDENIATERIILSKTSVPMVGRINEEHSFDKKSINAYAETFRQNIMAL